MVINHRWLKKVTAAIKMTTSIKKAAINLRIRRRRLAFESFARIVSMVSGMVKNDSERDDCTSIFFNAFRIELNLIFLYPYSIIALLRSKD